MSILSDFFVATHEQALRYANRFNDDVEDDEIIALLQPFQSKGITGLEMGMLWAIFEKTPWNVKRHMLQMINVGGVGESWLEQFPGELTTALAHATVDELTFACVQWIKTEELRGARIEEALPVLEELQRLSKIAISRRQALYLWGCV